MRHPSPFHLSRTVLLGLLASAALGGCFSPYHRAVNEWALPERELLALRLDEAHDALVDAVEAAEDALDVAHKAQRSGDADDATARRLRAQAADLAAHRVGQKVAAARDVLQRCGADPPFVAAAGDMLVRIEAAAGRLNALVSALDRATLPPLQPLADEIHQLQKTLKGQTRESRRVIDGLRGSKP